MAIHKFKRNNDFNYINNKSVLLDIQVEPEYENEEIMLLDTRIKSEYDKADTMQLDTPEGHEYENEEIIPLDTRIKSEYDNADTIQLDTRVKHEYDIERALKHEYDNEESSCHSRAQTLNLISLSPSGKRSIFPTLSPSGLTRGSSRKMKHCFSGYSCRSTNMTKGNNTLSMTTQSGRSMVEMLGVLAVMGVLSIGGIMGYNYAIAKTKSNSIMSELTLRAMALSASLDRTTPTVNTPLTMEMGTAFQKGYATTAKMSVNPEYFEITVQGVDKKTCELTLTDYNLSAFTIVNNALYENSTAVCNDAENDMTFVYKKDLGERRTCAAKGFFNIDSYKCECSGGTYFDAATKDCVCPAGTKWTGAECTESRCADNEFESLEGGCVSCEDPNGFRIDISNANTIALCEACEERYLSGESCIPDICTEGTFPSWGENNVFRCVECTSGSTHALSFRHDIAKEQCELCPNRHYVSFGLFASPRCLANTPCADGEFYGATACYACDTTKSILIGTISNSYEYEKVGCLACKKDGVLIRSVVVDEESGKIYCQKTTCLDTEFKGLDGLCYSCLEEKSIEIDGTSSGCEDVMCNRISKKVIDESGNIKTMCQIKTCDGVLLDDGSCYACDTTAVFKTTKEKCDSCGRRADGDVLRGYLSTGYCVLNKSILGKSYPYRVSDSNQGNPTYSCTTKSGFSDSSEYALYYCEQGCNNYLVDGMYCIHPNSCVRTQEFRSRSLSDKLCISCSYSEKIYIGNHEKQNDMCAACTTTPRFFADNYCYRCDSNESPVVTTAEEQASCTACPNRKIDAEGKCVLVVAEG